MARVALIQRAPAFLDRAACLDRAATAVAEAAAQGAALVVLPEAFVPGYPAWIWRLRPGTDMALSEQLHARLRENAVDLARDQLAPLREAARHHQVTVVCGIQERDAAFSRSTLYNSVVTIGPDGAILNRHRKVMPTNAERMVWGFGDATGIRSVDTPCGLHMIEADVLAIGTQAARAVVEHRAQLGQAPAQRATRVVGAFPEEVAQGGTGSGVRAFHEVGQQGPRAPRRRQRNRRAVMPDFQFSEQADRQRSGVGHGHGSSHASTRKAG